MFDLCVLKMVIKKNKMFKSLFLCTVFSGVINLGFAQNLSNLNVSKKNFYKFSVEELEQFKRRRCFDLESEIFSEPQDTDKISMTVKSKQIFSFFKKNFDDLKQRGFKDPMFDARSLSDTLFANYYDVSRIIKKRGYNLDPLTVVKFIETETNGRYGQESSKGALSSLQCYKNGAFADFFLGIYEKYNVYGKKYSNQIDDLLAENLFEFVSPKSNHIDDLRVSLDENWDKLSFEYFLNFRDRESFFLKIKSFVNGDFFENVSFFKENFDKSCMNIFLDNFRDDLHLQNPSEIFLREVGIMYLDYLSRVNHGDLSKISKSYNAGIGAVSMNLADKFEETSHYVYKISCFSGAFGNLDYSNLHLDVLVDEAVGKESLQLTQKLYK